ncbi:MAG: hypothetical protein EAZ97_14800 [Bacteroidetes bacterium]|nr:MAG: hypothetical protein EAZ97_14800 [Bacteroidota bacterium]
MFQKIIFLTFFCLLAMNVFGKSGYEKDWQKVDSLFQIRQYQSALTIVKSIYAKADKESNADQQVKSVVYQIFLMNYLEDTEKPKDDEDQDEGLKFFAFLDKEIAKAKSPVKPILHVLAAKSYWTYYEENQYEIQERTNTQNFNNQDIKTWALQNFVDRIQSHFKESLKEKTLLQQTPINTFFEVLGANANDKPEDFAKKQNLALRPTLYDFVVDQAIDFFANTQIDLPKPAYAFEINKAEYYADYQVFNKINLASKDSNNSKLMVLQLFQEVLKFHENDSDPKVLADFELKRILFVQQHSVLENKDQIYEKALNQIATKFKSAQAEYLIAEIYRDKNDLVKAFQLAQDLIKKYPNEIAAIKARNMILDIKSKNLSLSLPQYNPTLRSILSNLSYRNLTNLTCKIVVRKDDDMEKLNDYRLEKSEDRIKEIFARKSVRQWNIKLPESPDFQQHSAEMKVPDLDLGQYLIVIVDSSSLELKRTIAYQVFDVSNLMFTQRISKDGGNEFYVLDRNSGQAVPNVQTKATKYTYDYRKGKYDTQTIKSDPTDKDGYVKIQAWGKTQNQSYDYSYLQVDFLLGKDKVSTANITNALREKPDFVQKNAFFFMDRGIYRPSQTIYFKAVLLENRTGKRTILQKQKVEVRFYDVNDQMIATQTLTSNDYGTISGTFTAPQGVLNGNMSIDIDGFSCSNNDFSVEEYKRPKFEVKIENPKESFKLGDLVKVKANALAFSGAKITDAKAVFRVVRKTNLPYWYAWYYPSISVADMEIAKGEVKTNENGEAIIEFTAIPDLSVSKDGEPVFNYEISVDVTDLNGETQSSATTVSVGYKALIISTNIYEKVNKDEKNIFSISTRNLSGEDQIAKGNYSIFRLKNPEKLFRERRWSKPDQFLMDKNEFYATFPTDAYDQENDQSKWERQLVTTSAFSTPEKAVIDLAKLDQGVYFLEIKSQDQAGENVQSSQYFTVFSEKANKLPFLQTFSFQPLKVSGEPNETAKFLIGTSYRNAHILYEIEHENEIVEKKWLKISEKQELLEIPILEKYRGNFGFHVTFVMEDRIYQHSQTVSVPHSNKELDIEFETFRNKLLPNEKELRCLARCF